MLDARRNSSCQLNGRYESAPCAPASEVAGIAADDNVGGRRGTGATFAPNGGPAARGFRLDIRAVATPHKTATTTATGTAKSAPSGPNTNPAIKIKRNTTPGDRPSFRPMIFGVK